MKKSLLSVTVVLPFALPFVMSVSAFAADSLETELQNLELPSNIAPAGISVEKAEKLYSVQTRYSELSKRSEVSLGGGRNLTGSSFLNMNQVDLSYRFHINNRWGLVATGSYGMNSFTPETQTLINENQLIPDVAYVKYRSSLMLEANLFYGKFRTGMDKVLYFDQYVAAGPGLIWLQTGRQTAGVLDVGFAFWFGKNASVRLGLKNEFYNRKTLTASAFQHDLLGHLDVGYVFGGK
jgi:outer membrane beta-barrel protein